MILGDQNNYRNNIIDSLEPEMFTDGLNREMFACCVALRKLNKEINVYALCEYLGTDKFKTAIMELYEQYITNANYEYFVKKLQNSYLDRAIKQAQNINDLANIEQIKSRCGVAKMSALGDNTDELILDYYNEAETAVKSYYRLDNVIGSFRGGDYVILAAATGMGKTCFLLNLVKRMAEHNLKIDIFSLEMPKKQLQNRFIAAEIGINANKFRSFGLTRDEIKKYQEFAEKLKYYKINVCEEYRLDVERIRQYCMRSDADIVFVDYLGLIQNKNGRSRYEKVSEISTLLKQTAMETKKPFVVLHQLSRDVESRQDKTPRNSDLRDSGQTEQDADIIMLLYRPGYYETELSQKEAYLYITKNRHGASNTKIPLYMDLEKQRVYDINEV